MAHFWYRWPSWVVEAISGTLIAWLFLLPIFWPIKAAALVVGYEAFVDANGWSKKDVLQRSIGVVIGTALFYVIF